MYRTITLALGMLVSIHCGATAFGEMGSTAPNKLAGDFDSDGDRDADDVNALAGSGNLSTGYPPGPAQIAFDLDGNNWVDIFDLIAWLDMGTVEQNGATVDGLILGDANLDGDVDREDVSILNSSIASPPPLPAKYTCGDFNGDGVYDLRDHWIWLRASLFH